MPKKKKTRKQKELSDLRRKTMFSLDATSFELPSVVAKTPTLSITPVVKKVESQKDHASSLDYNFLKTDLLRTIYLTGIVVIVELLIRLFVKNI